MKRKPHKRYNMCLIVENKPALVAAADIKTWKVVAPGSGRLVWKSVFGFSEHEFRFDRRLCENAFPPGLRTDGRLSVGRGWFHSSLFLSDAENLLRALRKLGIGESEAALFRCTVPKGARYYKGVEGDIASDTITVHSV